MRGAPARRLHLTLALGLTICVGAFWIEVVRALGGHTYSWLYVFEWPIFASFGIYMWWWLLHEPSRSAPGDADGAPAPETKTADATAPAERDEDLERWQRYLRELQEADASRDLPS